MKEAAIFDLDGTLFDDSHRKHFVLEQKWDEYFSAGVSDAVNESVLSELLYQKELGRVIVIMTGCPEIHRDMTLNKLSSVGVTPDFIFMRPNGDYSKNHDLKKKWLNELSVKPVIAFDDMYQSALMFKVQGIKSFTVKNGLMSLTK